MSEDVSEAAHFFDEIQSLSFLFEKMQEMIVRGNYIKARRTIIRNAALIKKHWQSSLCITVLSGYCTLTRMCVQQLLIDADIKKSNELLFYLCHLDRIMELTGIHQSVSIIAMPVDTMFQESQLHVRGIRKTITQLIDKYWRVSFLPTPENRNNYIHSFSV